MRLYLFPHAGGSARSYAGWPASLAHCCQAVPCDTPGESRPYLDPPEALTIRQMGSRNAAFLARQPGPFALFGHSMGTLTAFETTRALRRMGAALPQLVILSAHRAPHLPMSRDALHALPDAEFDARLAGYAATPAELLHDAEMMELVRPLLRRDFAACETYHMQPGAGFDIPALCLGGIDDPDVTRADLDAWSQHFQPFLGTHLLPGGHFYHHKGRIPVAEIAQALSRVAAHDLAGAL